MNKILEARTFKGNVSRWEGAETHLRITSRFPDKGYYAIVSPNNISITMYKALDEHLAAGATVILSNKKEGYIQGWRYTYVRFSLWVVCDGGKFFRLCAFESYQKFLSRWSIAYEDRHVIIEKIKSQ